MVHCTHVRNLVHCQILNSTHNFGYTVCTITLGINKNDEGKGSDIYLEVANIIRLIMVTGIYVADGFQESE